MYPDQLPPQRNDEERPQPKKLIDMTWSETIGAAITYGLLLGGVAVLIRWIFS